MIVPLGCPRNPRQLSADDPRWYGPVEGLAVICLQIRVDRENLLLVVAARAQNDCLVACVPLLCVDVFDVSCRRWTSVCL